MCLAALARVMYYSAVGRDRRGDAEFTRGRSQAFLIYIRLTSMLYYPRGRMSGEGTAVTLRGLRPLPCDAAVDSCALACGRCDITGGPSRSPLRRE